MVDPLSAFFLILFGIGSLFTLLSFLFGVGHLGGVFHGHGGHDGHGLSGFGHGHGGAAQGHVGHGEAGSADGGVSPLNGFTVAAFLIWFGAAGFLAFRVAGWATPVGLAVAVAGGLAAATTVFLFLARVLIPNQTVMHAADYRREGTVARVTTSIPPGGVGEIVYTLQGVRHSDAARQVPGATAALTKGEEVVITGFERGVALVQSVRELLDEPDTGRREAPAR